MGKLLSVTCRCGGVWESPELANLRVLLDQLSEVPAASAMRDALGLANAEPRPAAA